LHDIFSNEEYILWPAHQSRRKIHILISLTSPSVKVHFKAWAHAYVLALLLSQGPLSRAGIGGGLEAMAGEVRRAGDIVSAAFEGEIERALAGKGWNVEKSMMCVHLDGGGRADWKVFGDDKIDDLEKRA